MMRNKEEIRLQRVVALLCATIFAVFSFLFISKYQAPLLELLYDKVSTGKLQYNATVVGAVITLLLTLAALWLNRYVGFKREWTALSYIPAVLLLSFITDIDRSLYIGGYDYNKWIIIFAVGLFIYASFSFILRRMLFAKIKNISMSANRIVWRNLQIFVIMFCAVGFFASGEENFKREALVASYSKKGDIEKALNVGKLSLVASPHLTAQRAFLLAKNGVLGEQLFEYPQFYGSEGLIPALERQSPLVPDSVYSMLGVVPSQGEKAVDLLSRAVNSETHKDKVKDYYLSALLLDRRIVEFVNAVGELYPETEFSDLPKHYQEALILYASIDDDITLEMNNSVLQERFDAFKALEAEHDDLFVKANYVRREFGNTYWWYFLYGNM